MRALSFSRPPASSRPLASLNRRASGAWSALAGGGGGFVMIDDIVSVYSGHSGQGSRGTRWQATSELTINALRTLLRGGTEETVNIALWDETDTLAFSEDVVCTPEVWTEVQLPSPVTIPVDGVFHTVARPPDFVSVGIHADSTSRDWTVIGVTEDDPVLALGSVSSAPDANTLPTSFGDTSLVLVDFST